MTLVEKLRIIGFTNFKHLRHEDRDEKKRMTWTTVVDGNLFTIRIVETGDDTWEIDYINPSHALINKNLLSMQFEEAINYLVKHAK